MCDNETTVESPPAEPKRKRISAAKLIRYSTIIVIACTAGYINYNYASTLFENDRHFSHLSEMEREMSLHSEMGFYYSYYKTVVHERPFMLGIGKLMYDRLVEYPNEVNAFNRFNIHPEVIIAAIYRYFEPILNTTAHRECHIVSRGEGLSPVESCTGLGQPIFFYLRAGWALQGVYLAALCLHAVALSDSILGGVLTVTQFFANHVDCTRVHWAPNQRENMAVPFLALQMWLVSLQLRDRERRTHVQMQVAIFILNCICLLFWQFSQFILLTQIAIFFVMEQLKIIELKPLCILLHSHFCGLHMAVLLLQGNDMLKSSLYASFFIVLSTYCMFFSSFRVKVQNRKDLLKETWLVVLRITIVVGLAIYLKKIIGDFLGSEEDLHIWQILQSKLSNFRNFHTTLYTCSNVFDFLPFLTVKKLFFSFLIPFVLLSVVNVCRSWLTDAIVRLRQDKCSIDKKKEEEIDNDSSSDEDSGIDTEAKQDLNLINKDTEAKINDDLMLFLKYLKIDAAIFYNISQMVVYGVMAGLVMRLKLLFVPQMCVVSALIMSRQFYRLPSKYTKLIPLFWLISLLSVLRTLYHNVNAEMSVIGEYSDPAKERLLLWVMREGSRSVFAGSMPLMATVLLVARRAVIAHPHYEHQEARQRAYSVYKVYGRFTEQELYEDLTKLRATHLIVETSYCYGRTSTGCSYSDIWAQEPGHAASRAPLCRVLLGGRGAHFYPAYRDARYAVFRIHDYSVRYMPRSFDT